MKKVTSMILAVSMTAGLFTAMPQASAATGTSETTIVQQELYRLDFDDLAVSPEGTIDGLTELSSKRSDFVVTAAQDGTRSNTIQAEADNPNDKYFKLYQIAEGNTDHQIQFKMPEAVSGSSIYHFSYDIKWKRNASSTNGPFIRTRSYHYDNGALNDPWGPTLSMIGPYSSSDTNMYARFSTAAEKPMSNDGWWERFDADTNKKVMSDEEWHRVEIVYDASKKAIKYYYDGEYYGTDISDGSQGDWGSFPFLAKCFTLQISGGWQSWPSVMIDNVSFTKEIASKAQVNGVASVAVSKDKNQIAVTLDNSDTITTAKVINVDTGANIASSVASSKGKAYITLSSTLSDDANYCIYLDSSSKRYTANLVQVAAGKIAKKFDFSTDEGVTVTGTGTGSAIVEGGVLKLKGTTSADTAKAVLSLGSNAVPAGTSYEVSYDYRANTKNTVMKVKLNSDFLMTVNDGWWNNDLSYVNGAQWNWWENLSGFENWWDNPISATIKAKFDAEAIKADYYLGDVLRGTVSGESFMTTENGYNAATGGLSEIALFAEYNNDAVGMDVEFDNVTVTVFSNSEIHAIDWNGNDLFFAKTMDRPIQKIEVKNANSVSLTKDGGDVPAKGSLDEATGVYTLTPQAVLKNGNYVLTVDGVSHSFVIDADIQEGYVVSSLQIIDEDGVELKGTNDIVAGDKVLAKAVVNNGYMDEKTVDLYVAVYNGDDLIAVSSATENIPAGKAQSLITSAVTVDSVENLAIKAFLWENETLKPLCTPEVCNRPFRYDRVATTVNFDGSSFDEVSGAGTLSNGTFKYASEEKIDTIKNFDKSVSDEILHISFDYKPMSYLNFFWIRILGDGVSDQIFADRGAMAYYPDSKTWEISDKRIGYEPGNWYNVDIYADFVTNMLYYYQNDTLFGSAEFKGGDSAFNKIEFCSQYGDETYLDNLVIEQLGKKDANLPAELKQKAAVDIGTTEFGRIFYDKDNAVFDITVTNKKNLPADYTIYYFIYDEAGNTVFEGEDNLSLAAGEIKKYTKALKPASYGFFKARALLADESNTVAKSILYDFSVCRDTDVKDENMGVQLTSSTGIDRDDFDRYKTVPMLSKLGFSFTRGTNVSYGSWDPTTQTIGFGEWDEKWYNTAKDNGIELFHLMTGTNKNFKNDAGTKVQNPPVSNDAIEAFANSAVAACDKYKEIYGHSPKDLDVWNEYWMTGSVFNPDSATAADYVNLLAAVYTKVKAKHPDTMIWGLSGVGYSEVKFDNWDSYAWTKEVLENIVAYNDIYGETGPHMDGISLHPYTDWSIPEDGNPVNIVNKYKELFAQYGFDGLPMVASEWGWASGGSDGDPTLLPNEQEQASYFVRANTINRANNLFSKVCWYGSSDVSNDDSNRQNNYGLIRGAYDVVGYEAKPQLLTAGAYMDIMTGATYVDDVKISDQVRLYRFRPRDAKSANDYVFVLWAKDTNQQVNIEFKTVDNSGMTLTDKYGNESHMTGNNDIYTLNLTIDPCYLRGEITNFLVK